MFRWIRRLARPPAMTALALAALLALSGPAAAQYYNQGFNQGFSSSNYGSGGSYSGAPAYYPAPQAGYQPAQPSSRAVSGLETSTASREVRRAFVTIRAPRDAQVWLEGVKATRPGPEHKFRTQPLPAGQTQRFVARARWVDEDGKEVNQTRTVPLRGGQRKVVRFTEE